MQDRKTELIVEQYPSLLQQEEREGLDCFAAKVAEKALRAFDSDVRYPRTVLYLIRRSVRNDELRRKKCRREKAALGKYIHRGVLSEDGVDVPIFAPPYDVIADVRAVVSQLAPDEQIFVRDRYYGDRTLKSIALRNGWRDSQVRRLKKTVEIKLKRSLITYSSA